MNYKFYIVAALLFLLFSGLAQQARAADQSIMLEVGWRFDNVAGAQRNAFDFGAVRYRYNDGEVHIATWRNSEGSSNIFTGGVGYVLDSEDTDDAYVSFTPGLAYTTGPAPLRVFTRTALGYADGDMGYEVAHNAYMPLIQREIESDAFATVGVRYNEYDDDSRHGPDRKDDSGDDGDNDAGNNGDDDDDGDDGDGDGESCKPGHGHGDTNHCHSGPPGQNK